MQWTVGGLGKPLVEAGLMVHTQTFQPRNMLPLWNQKEDTTITSVKRFKADDTFTWIGQWGMKLLNYKHTQLSEHRMITYVLDTIG